MVPRICYYQKWLHKRRFYCTDSFCCAFLLWAFTNAASYCLHNYNGHTLTHTLTAMVWLFSMACFHMSPQIACQREGIFTVEAFFVFRRCVFSNEISNWFHPRKHTYTCHIYLFFIHCVFSNVSSNYLHQKRHIHIGCIYFAFLHCVFSNVSSMHLRKKIISHIGCNALLIHCVILCVSSNCLHEKVHSHIGCNWLHCYAFLLLCICKAAVELWKKSIRQNGIM